MKKIALKQKFIVIFILISLISSILTASLFLYRSKKLVEDKINSFTKQISLEKVSYIDSFIYSMKTSVESVSKNPNVLKKDPNGIMEVIKSIKDANVDILSLYIGTSDKQTFLYPGKVPEGYDPTSRGWYKNAVASFGSVVITNPYEDAFTGKFIITVSKAFRLSNGQVAVAAADVDLEKLCDYITKTQVGQTGYAALILEDGTIIAHPNKDMLLVNIAEKYDFGKKIIEMKEGNLKYTLDKEEKISGFAKSKQTGWIAIATMNEREYGKEFEKSIIQTVIFLIITLGIVALLALVLAKNITNPLVELMKLMKRAEEGDMSLDIKVTGKDEIGKIQESFKNMILAQRDMIVKIKESVENVLTQAESLTAVSEEMASSSQEVAKTMQQVAEGSTSQANDLQGIINLMQRLTDAIENAYSELVKVKEDAEDTTDKANEGKKEMDNLVRVIDEIKEAFEAVINKINNLIGSLKQISNITEVINGISEQTNLLALNAAIEAARAGEMGKGFAVVADEVRKLAEESKRSTKEINELLKGIQKDAEEVINTSREVSDFIKEQTSSVENTVKTFEGIIDSIENIVPLIEKVNRDMDEVIKSRDEVITKVEGVSAVTQENSAAAQEVAASSEELSASSEEVAASAQNLTSVAQDLSQVINQFKV